MEVPGQRILLQPFAE